MSISDNPKEIRKLIYLDLQPSGGLDPSELRAGFRKEFETQLDGMIARASALPKIAIPFETRTEQVATNLLLEARALYLHGFYYSCIAMCGIVSERIVKDIFRSNTFVAENGKAVLPSSEAFDQLERVDLTSIVKFCFKTNLINKTVSKSAEDLLQLRNKYAHARGQDAEADAKKAFGFLNLIVDETISVLNKIKFN